MTKICLKNFFCKIELSLSKYITFFYILPSRSLNRFAFLSNTRTNIKSHNFILNYEQEIFFI